MKRYILLIGIIVMPLSLLSNPNQLTGPLNDLTQALRGLQQKISGVQPVSAWVQQLQALEQQMDQIQQSAVGCGQTQLLYPLSANHTKLINDNGAIAQYKQAYNKYALLPYTFEMDCILAGINPLININQGVTPLLQDYEATYGSYIKIASGLKALPDQKYANELKRVRNYVTQYKPTVTPPPSSSQVTPPPPPPFPTSTSSSQGITPPPPPPPIPTGPTKIPTSSQSTNQPAPTTTGSKPTGGKPGPSFLGEIISGVGVGGLKHVEPFEKPETSESAHFRAIRERGSQVREQSYLEALERAQQEKLDRLKESESGSQSGLQNVFEEAMKDVEIPQVEPTTDSNENESDWDEPEEAPKGPSSAFINQTKKDYALTQDKDIRLQINQQRVAAGLNELPAGYQAGEEQQIRNDFDKDTKKKFLNTSPGIRNKVNADRRKAGLSELPAGYYLGEQERMREDLDVETKTQILDASDKSDPQDKEELFKIAAKSRREFGLSTAKNDMDAVREAEQYAVAFTNFKQQNKLTKAVSPVDQDVHDETVRRWFVAKDVYKNQQSEAERLLNDINQERSAYNLPPLKQ